MIGIGFRKWIANYMKAAKAICRLVVASTTAIEKIEKARIGPDGKVMCILGH